jgi:hypothetical protein
MAWKGKYDKRKAAIAAVKMGKNWAKTGEKLVLIGANWC